MRRLLTAPSPEEAGQRALQTTEALEVVVVRDFAAEPLPDRLDRVQVRAVGRQEAQAKARLLLQEGDQRCAAMPRRPIEDQHDQHSGIGVEQLLTEPLEVRGGQSGREAVMELARDHVEGPEAVDLLMGPGPVARPRLLAAEAPLLAERRSELDRDLVLEQHGQPVRCLLGEAQEPSNVAFF